MTTAITESLALCLTAATVGAVHTLLGPDHYVPFVAMSRAGRWPLGKTLRVTAACGLGHVAGSVAIGVVGLALGLAVMQLETLEALRGDVAAWLMIGFGLAYCSWGLVRASRSHGTHVHVHIHADVTVHSHDHTHGTAHLHVHESQAAATPIWSPWLLFLVFAFGPCEPLIPLLMYPTAGANWWAVAAVASAFAAATIATMTAAVVVLRGGAAILPTAGLERYSHAVAGIAILTCGILITLGL